MLPPNNLISPLTPPSRSILLLKARILPRTSPEMETVPPTIVTSPHSTFPASTVMVPPNDGLCWLLAVHVSGPPDASAVEAAVGSRPVMLLVMNRETITTPISKNRSRDNRAAFTFSIDRTPDHVQVAMTFAIYASRG